MGRTPRYASLLAALATVLLPAAPARALEEVLIELPLLQTTFSLRLNELASVEALRQGNSDLAELDRASRGAVGRQLIALLQQPVPLSLKQVAEGSVGSPLLEQAMLVIASLGSVEGRAPDLSGTTLRQALITASANGDPTVFSLMKAIPGERVRLNLGRARQIASRLTSQRRQAESLLARTAPASLPPSLPAQPAGSVRQRQVFLTVPHRPEPLELLVLEPGARANGRLVLISHGLWDTPTNFKGWGALLAASGYTVALPRHPGSDNSQQQRVLTGQAPPPGPEELAQRPRDLSAVIDAAASGALSLAQPVATERVVVLGHSWGATTALQLAGLTPKDASLRDRCRNLDDPERNLSWTLQCSWLNGVQDASLLRDPRVVAVAAVSPPVSLLFPEGSARLLGARVLLVSGGSDWIVPPDPEAIEPMRRGARLGNQLVLVRDGDHFNLRPGENPAGGALGPLLRTWTEAAFAAGAAVAPAPGARPLLPPDGWGSASLPMADVTPQLGDR
jgi:predicted dienelactone hydrolase